MTIVIKNEEDKKINFIEEPTPDINKRHVHMM